MEDPMPSKQASRTPHRSGRTSRGWEGRAEEDRSLPLHREDTRHPTSTTPTAAASRPQPSPTGARSGRIQATGRGRAAAPSLQRRPRQQERTQCPAASRPQQQATAALEPAKPVAAPSAAADPCRRQPARCRRLAQLAAPPLPPSRAAPAKEKTPRRRRPRGPAGLGRRISQAAARRRLAGGESWRRLGWSPPEPPREERREGQVLPRGAQ
ncbi:hypothetical protein BRADI_1g33061v3 [Brachypodium distachyon]|uniref:Uncharacterized protein n=1 Tax=Brachypodium distachyon TaxID=15368 RepID=A0A0Q3JHE6_BRADI|nr:hypothetical protein BRADI_1g33061v3 [Brachypodium distachyon]